MTEEADREAAPAAAWARGVAANAAAPAGVLLRLLDAADSEAARAAWEVLCGGRALPDEVVTAIVEGPEAEPKHLLARNPYATPEQRGRLATDPDAMVRIHVAGGPKRGSWPVQPLPDAVVEAFFTADDRDFPPGVATTIEIGQELAFSGQVPGRYYYGLFARPDPEMRRGAAMRCASLPPEQQAALLADPDPAVRAAAEEAMRRLDAEANEARLPDHWTHARTHMMMHLPVTHAVAERELGDPDGRWTLAYNQYTPPDIVELLAGDADPYIRSTIATRYGLPPQIRARLEEDPDEGVRTTAAAFAAATSKAQHITLLRIVSSGSFWPPPDYDPAYLEGELGDPDWYIRAAESANVLLRRAAARDPRLPPAQVRLLAADADREVRSLLAHHHPAAPPDLMIEVFVAEPAERALLLHLPQMPRTGLAPYLTHPEPRVRALAAADPTLPAPPVAQLEDEDEAVRRAAAANPLIPTTLLDRLLQDPRHAEGAAANPQLDGEALHRLLDAAGIPRRTTDSPSPPTLLFVVGPPAVGKATVGQAIADRTGMRLFHNHLSIELALRYFDYGTPAFHHVNDTIRHLILDEVAASDLPGLVFTYVWAFDDPAGQEYVDAFAAPFRARGGRVLFLELEATQSERLRRNVHPSRLAEKPSKRDVRASELRLLDHDARYQLNSTGFFDGRDDYLRVDNTDRSPDWVAEHVVEHFKLRRPA